MTISQEIEAFVAMHSRHGNMSSEISDPEPSGYTVIIICQCGERFERWVTPEAARRDLVFSSLIAKVYNN